MSISTTLVLSSLLFAALGIGTFALAFWLIDKATPYDLWREVVEKQNVALSVLLGEGTGGGALALLPADRTIAAEHAWLHAGGRWSWGAETIMALTG